MIDFTGPYRWATADDAEAMAELVNMAGEGMPLYFWEQLAGPGESAWDIGRSRARRETGGFSHRNTVVRAEGHRVVACLIGYPLADDPEPVDYGNLPTMFVPLQQLEDLAPATWYVNVLASYPPHRGKGYGAELLTPFLLGAIFRAHGWYDSPFNLYPAKGRYMWRDLARICESDGIPFRRPSEFPRNGLLAARVACRFSGAPWLPGFVRAVYRANFGDDLDIANPAILARCLASVGVDCATALREAQSEEAKLALRHQTDEAVRLGVFGAPSFVVDGELFWGNDRLEDALVWAAKRATDH